MCRTITAGRRRPGPDPDGTKYSAWTVLFSGSGVTIGEGNLTARTVYPGVSRIVPISYGNTAGPSRNRSGTLASSGDGRKTASPLSKGAADKAAKRIRPHM